MLILRVAFLLIFIFLRLFLSFFFFFVSIIHRYHQQLQVLAVSNEEAARWLLKNMSISLRSSYPFLWLYMELQSRSFRLLLIFQCSALALDHLRYLQVLQIYQGSCQLRYPRPHRKSCICLQHMQLLDCFLHWHREQLDAEYLWRVFPFQYGQHSDWLQWAGYWTLAIEFVQQVRKYWEVDPFPGLSYTQ